MTVYLVEVNRCRLTARASAALNGVAGYAAPEEIDALW
jgi:hypothetical protein